MIIHKREMSKNQETKTADNNINEYLPNSQASFNSDGKITLRNYDKSNKNKDEIIIFSDEETRALFELFSQIGTKCKNYTLPF